MDPLTFEGLAIVCGGMIVYAVIVGYIDDWIKRRKNRSGKRPVR
nr:MAG TPA: chitin synthase regulator [Caudoviricetes sp.]